MRGITQSPDASRIAATIALGSLTWRSAWHYAARRIIDEVRGPTRVVYDITSKPPGTNEWE